MDAEPGDAEFGEHSISVPRTARYVSQGSADAREVWFCLHGYGETARGFLEGFAELRAAGRYFLAPEALSRFYRSGGGGEVGASWMTRAARDSEIEDYVRYLDAVYGAALGSLEPQARIHVLGFSQGASTALRWALLGSARVDHLTLWGGDVPPELDLEALRQRLGRLSLVLVAGERDRFYGPRIERDARTLADAGAAVRVVRFEGGHRLDRSTLAALAEAVGR